MNVSDARNGVSFRPSSEDASWGGESDHSRLNRSIQNSVSDCTRSEQAVFCLKKLSNSVELSIDELSMIHKFDRKKTGFVVVNQNGDKRVYYVQETGSPEIKENRRLKELLTNTQEILDYLNRGEMHPLLECFISKKPLNNVVISPNNGESYEKNSLDRCETDPLTREEIREFYENIPLIRIIDKLKLKFPHLWNEM